MELNSPKRIHKYYWSLSPIILIIIGYQNIFNHGNFHSMGSMSLKISEDSSSYVV